MPILLLFKGTWNKRLTAKAGIDRHNDYQVKIGDNIAERRAIGVWIDSHSCFGTAVLDLLDDSVKMRACFVVYRDVSAPASRHCSIYLSGWTVIRCTSNGFLLTYGLF